jgi:hypothetical protein
LAKRTGFGDETWRLALEGDVPALERVGRLLLDDEPGSDGYDGHRARGFALAVGGRVPAALAELNEGWTDEWPFPAAYAADVARVHFLGGDYSAAIDALQLSSRSADVRDPSVAELAAACVERSPGCFGRALKVALGSGTPWQRAGAALAVVRARF